MFSWKVNDVTAKCSYLENLILGDFSDILYTFKLSWSTESLKVLWDNREAFSEYVLEIFLEFWFKLSTASISMTKTALLFYRDCFSPWGDRLMSPKNDQLGVMEINNSGRHLLKPFFYIQFALKKLYCWELVMGPFYWQLLDLPIVLGHLE